MGLKSWWREYRMEGIQIEVEELCEEYIHEKDAVEPYHQFKKQLERECFPQKGDDLLAKKETFINGSSSREREFQETYMTEGNNILNPMKSQVSRNYEQNARLIAHRRWQKLLLYSGLDSKGHGRIRT